MSAVKRIPKGNGLLPGNLGEAWQKIGYALGALGVLAFLAGFFGADRTRFAAAYLVGFLFTTTIAIGALFFVVIQHLTKAGWSVGPRRIMEWISQGLIASAILFIPILLMSHDIWHHWMGEQAKHDPILIAEDGVPEPDVLLRAGDRLPGHVGGARDLVLQAEPRAGHVR